RYIMVGATPRKLHSWACTTFKARPTATPASIALPPRRRISSPAIAATGWLETTTPFVPWMRGRKLVKVVPGTVTMTSFPWLILGTGERRLASCPSGPLASSDAHRHGGDVGLDLVLPHTVHCWRSTIVAQACCDRCLLVLSPLGRGLW